MAISREDILVDNIKEALALYQRSLVWATTAALSGGLIAFRLRDGKVEPVSVLSGTLSAPAAWGIAQVIYLVFGGLAFSSLRRYQLALQALDPPSDIFDAIRLFPSLATLPGNFFRLGSVLLPLLVTYASWVIELTRENAGSLKAPEASWWGVILVALLLLAPYAGILAELRNLRLWLPRDCQPEARPAKPR